MKRFIPIIAHNSKNYDNHFIIEKLFKFNDVSCVADNTEKYKWVKASYVINSYKDKEGKEHNLKYQIKFIDSFSFLSASLENLTNNLKLDCKSTI